MEAGSDAAVAEREALTELGDPARLAAGYADRNPAFAQARGWPTTVTNWINPGVLIAGVISVLVTIGQLVSGFATRSWASADLGAMIRTSVTGIAKPRRR